ncbi:MAG: dTDP-4-dehydrorhamnose 3,5-epimerase [Saprospiraceae bacterium]
MSWTALNIKGTYTFEPKIWGDDRGYFFESFNASTLPVELKNIHFVQDNEAKSVKGVIRGLHYQKGDAAQSKLVRCVEGEILDVIVDLRPDSLTYGQHISVILNDITKKQLFVPRGFAHGYIVLSETAVFAYKCDNYYNPSQEGGIHYLDKDLDIDWILPKENHIISEKDAILPKLAQLP